MGKKEDGKLSAVQIISIVSGIIVIPIILTGASFGAQMEMSSLYGAIAISTIILAVLALTNVMIGFNRQKTSDEILAKSFGNHGYKIIVTVFALAITGWCIVSAFAFGNYLNVFLESLIGYSINIPLLSLIGCCIFVVATGFGLQRIGTIAIFCTSITFALMILLQIMFTVKSGASTQINDATISMGAAITQLIGALIVLTVTVPDFGKFARSKRDAVLGIGVVYLILIPLLIALVVLPAASSNKSSYIEAMAITGTGSLAVLVLIIATVSGNIGNFFKASLSFAEIFNISRTPVVVVVGIISAIACLFDINAVFFTVLGYLGVIIPTIAGVYICQEVRGKFYSNDKEEKGFNVSKYNLSAFIAVIVSSIVGILTLKGVFTLTTIPAIDSLLITFIIYFILPRLELGRSVRS